MRDVQFLAIIFNIYMAILMHDNKPFLLIMCAFYAGFFCFALWKGARK